MKIIRKHYGTIELGSSIMLSDPCYEPDTWCSATLHIMRPGIYDCYADFCDQSEWGIRVTRLVIVPAETNETLDYRHEVQACLCVDAGVFGVYDRTYFHRKKSENAEAWYDTNVLSWCMKEEAFICEDGKGFITTSGFGDGVYEAFCSHDESGRINAISVVFIQPEEDDKEGFEVIDMVDNETDLSCIKGILKNS